MSFLKKFLQHKNPILLLIAFFAVSVIGTLFASVVFFGGNNIFAAVANSFKPKITCATTPTPPFVGEKPDQRLSDLNIGLLKGANQSLFKLKQKNEKIFGERSFQFQPHTLRDLLKERKSAFLEVVRRDPDAAFAGLLSPADRKDLLSNKLTRNCIEEPTVVEGTLEIFHADFFDDNLSVEEYVLTTSRGKRIILHPARGIEKDITSGIELRVSGYLLDNDLLFDGSDPNSLEIIDGTVSSIFGTQAEAAHLGSLGPQNVVVLMVNFQDTTQPSLTRAEVADVVFNKVGSYYNEVSYNKTNLVGSISDVYGWYSLPINKTCNIGSTRTATINAADADINFLNYDRLIIIAPFSGCSWAGFSTFGKSLVSTDDGVASLSSALIQYTYTNKGIIGHELGHSLGVHHASFLNCGDVSLAESGCTVSEYGDRYDIMGSWSRTGHMNAPHKEYMGWFSDSNILEVTVDGTYIIEPIEIASAGTKAIKIPRAFNDYLFIEYRQSIGEDTLLSSTSDVFDGGLIHTLKTSTKTLLIDARPLESTTKTILLPGIPFTDPKTGTVITVTNKTSSALTLDVVVGETDFVGPDVSITSPTEGAIVSGTTTITAIASDEAGVASVEFWVAGGSGSIGIDYTAPYSVSWDTTYAPLNGTNWLYVVACDTLGNCSSGNTISVEVENVDPIPPTITSFSPTEGEVSGNPVMFSVTASDNIGVKHVEFWIDGFFYYYLTQEPYSVSQSIAVAAHTFQVKVYDFVGNVTETPLINFTVGDIDTIPPTVSITNPLDGDFVQGTVTVNTNAFDNVGVTLVEFYKDGSATPFATDVSAPFDTLWNTTAESDGVHTLTAKAYDAVGNETTSVSISVTVDNTSPSISLINPVDGSIVSGDVSVSASASDNLSVGRVDFYRDGGLLIGSDSFSPYSIIWDSTSVSNGAHSFFAKAVDNAGNETTSTSHNVIVDNGAPDTIPPTVSITSPADGSTVEKKSTVTITADASDNVGVTKVEFYVNGTLKCSDATASYSCNWKVPAGKGGTYQLQAKAYDAAGNSDISAIVTLSSGSGGGGGSGKGGGGGKGKPPKK